MKNEILNLENKYWEAMASKDYEAVKSLTRFPCILAGKPGVKSFDETAFKKMFDQGNSKNMKVNGISQEQIQAAGDHAMIGYLIEMDYEGKTMTCVCTSTWVKEEGKWVCAMHTEFDLEVKGSRV